MIQIDLWTSCDYSEFDADVFDENPFCNDKDDHAMMFITDCISFILNLGLCYLF